MEHMTAVWNEGQHGHFNRCSSLVWAPKGGLLSWVQYWQQLTMSMAGFHKVKHCPMRNNMRSWQKEHKQHTTSIVKAHRMVDSTARKEASSLAASSLKKAAKFAPQHLKQAALTIRCSSMCLLVTDMNHQVWPIFYAKTFFYLVFQLYWWKTSFGQLPMPFFLSPDLILQHSFNGHYCCTFSYSHKC